jgi:hypothetical protein
MNWAMLGVTDTGLPRSRTALVSALPHFDAPAMRSCGRLAAANKRIAAWRQALAL